MINVGTPTEGECETGAMRVAERWVLCRTPFVTVMQATNLRDGDDAAIGWPGHLARDGRIFVKGKMSPRSQVVGYESNEVATQTAFRDDDHVIPAFASDRADHAFDVGALPR